ncbi:restriction endonuclease subunit S [Sulfurovum riftiae]|uniref:Type I restriction modification DNA specificity domain-containing protein n=1 Tax=Sulfurovum riftiae TaxID=1630136 RepID=A0A151CJI0_9BACT|nr:restriction endonuclease subunit S [Sulfurovum riftiae]KYJ87671.1 hypothetical protein AS592_11300 [Sulfurovum riftiae]
MASFSKVKLGEIANIKGGKRLPKGHTLLYDKTLHPYIRARDIKDGVIIFDDPVYIDQSTYEKIQRYTVDKGDVCITIVGANVGDVGQVPTFLDGANLTENAVKLVAKDNDEYIADYIKYALQTQDAQKQMKNAAAGAAQPKLGIYKIKEVEIFYPSKNIRARISTILSTYDDLIENNNRRIAILEEMAQKLYREWFVKFRFPGHEKVKMVESEFGLIPEGWEVVKLSEMCNLTMGQSPKSEFYNENKEGIPFYQGVADFGLRFPKERVYCTKPTRFAKEGDILFSVRAPVGRLNIANSDLSIGRGLSAINHKDGYQTFLYQQLKYLFRVEDSMGNGSIFNSVTKRDMQNIDLLKPAIEIVEKFEEIAIPMFDLLDNLEKRNINLKGQRDLLLPKLISGKINV